jgi:hypothetical protein
MYSFVVWDKSDELQQNINEIYFLLLQKKLKIINIRLPNLFSTTQHKT